MILHADNFSIYGTNTGLMTQGIYASVTATNLVTDPDGRSGGRVIFVTGISQGVGGIRFVLPGNRTKVGLALRLWMNNLPSSNGAPYGAPIQWRTADNGVLAEIRVRSTGTLALVRANTLLGETSGPVVTAKGWWHIEAMLDVTNGQVEVRVEGRTVLTVTNSALTGIGQIAQTFWASANDTSNNSFPIHIKDAVIWDNTGLYNNNFLGSVLVAGLVPNSDVALNWTPVGGATGFGILDNVPPNDSQYIAAENDPIPAPYLGGMTDLPEDATTVRGIITYVRAAKSDGGDGSMQVGLVSNGDIALGENRSITVAQTYWRDIFETDPDTMAPWLPGAVNAAQIRIDRTT